MQNQEKRNDILSSLKRTLTRDGDYSEIERVAGLFPRGYLSILASAPGTGKTWLVQYIACQLSVGGEILGGMDTSLVPQKTLIFAGETGVDLLNRRFAKTSWRANPAFISIYSALDMAEAQIPFFLSDPAGQETIFRIIGSERPSLVFFDTLISWHALDESKQGEMTKVFLFLHRLAKIFDCAVVCCHHTRKKSQAASPDRVETQDDVIGTSAGVRLANSVFLIKSEDLGSGRSKMTVREVKSWERKKPPFSYTFVKKDGLVDFDIDLYVAKQWRLEQKLEELLSFASPAVYISASDLTKTWHCAYADVVEVLDRECEGENPRLKKVRRGKAIFYAVRDGAQREFTDI